jgi:threonine dehydratase
MIAAIRHLYEREGVIAEPAGAAATAAFLATNRSGGPTVLLVTGGNISSEIKRQAGIQ